MADKLQGTWVLDHIIGVNSGNTDDISWDVNFTSNGKSFDRIIMTIPRDYPGYLSRMSYRYADGFTDENGGSGAWAYPGEDAYRTLEIHSCYNEVEDADTLIELLSQWGTFTPYGEDIKIPMTSAKGVLLKTIGKFCDNDIVVTPELEELTVTENGEYTPSKVGYSKVSVNVSAPTTSEPNIQPLTVTENGTYTAPDGVDGYSPVSVEVTPDLEELTVTENGEYTPSKDGYSKVTVNVAASGGDEMSLERVFSGESVEVNLPNITKIKGYAFYNHTDIKKVSIPKVTEIGAYAFSKCGNLETIELSSELSIGNYCFQSCSRLALTKLPEGLNVGTHCFTGCTNLALTSLPSGWTEITDNLFQNCSNMALTALPSGITQIGNYAFNSCSKLVLTEFPSALTKIGNNAFQYCYALTSITFKGTPTSIASNAFSGINKLTTINVPWAEGAVSGAPWGATNATINYNYTGG